MLSIMSDVATKDDIKELRGELRSSFDDITSLIQSFMEQVDNRFNKVERDILELKESHERLLNTIDGFVAGIDR